MGGACSTYGGDERGIQVGKPERNRQLGRPGVDGSIILSWILRKWNVEGMDWNDLAEDRDRWRTIVNAVMNLRVP